MSVSIGIDTKLHIISQYFQIATNLIEKSENLKMEANISKRQM